MGKTIKIYLPNDTVSGIRHAEIANWTGQALACPRSRFQELRNWPQMEQPGVYFLFGINDETNDDIVYVGEAEVVIDRLSSHITGKDFWTEVITFTSKDENLTKAHVRYLESKLISMIQEAGRYKLTNATSPQLPSLPLSDRDAMDEYLESVKMLLGALGHKILEKLISPPTSQLPAAALTEPMQKFTEYFENIRESTIQTPSPVFFLKAGGLNARAVRTDEGVVVFEGSEAAKTTTKSLSGSMQAIREAMIQSGALVSSGDKLRMTRDYLFKSPSQAAGILVGYPISGPKYWCLEDGTTYTQYEERRTVSMIEELAQRSYTLTQND